MGWCWHERASRPAVDFLLWGTQPGGGLVSGGGKVRYSAIQASVLQLVLRGYATVSLIVFEI
jgi:hypothetical protein